MMNSQTPKLILLVASNQERRTNTAQRLVGAGVSVLVADCAQAAMVIVRSHRPTVVILDEEFITSSDIREDLIKAGLHSDTPFIALVSSAKLRPGTNLPHGILSYPLSDVGINSIMTIQPMISQKSAGSDLTDSVARHTSLLYALPHEYRTPLTDIIGQSSYLHGHALEVTPAEIREVSGEVLSAARRLLRVTDNFLMYAQIETLAENPLHIERMRQFKTIEPGSIVYDTATYVAELHHRRKDLTISLDVDGVPVSMLERHLNKVTCELLDNALYFSPAGSPVTLTANPQKSKVVFSISDHGIGMKEQELRQIGAYRQFRRQVQEQQGVGLGLVIAKRLVEIHGGTFDIQSTYGVGTNITFTVPRAA
ncbi:MAG: hybrid sensor histidine kinase/response regulator [Chlorobi bacterium]|nr:hybrid sensor histidine kinase/response regulator [Flavobacteriales bacterium]MBL1161587.1 hybrid sensor histidine kinase/response regulator [Chlorobiota bacterium]MCC6332241.1 hybrid sensor histidine kinase/response regulator [Ignavibacteria bacterium]WKZ77438.1 MAG: HAMP domain-containing sensor histidine kinase [Candidatus Kapabacteria bacterium]MBV6462781.1 Adaptive-response sensory-kinase SasA [Chlorobiota bacterium]